MEEKIKTKLEIRVNIRRTVEEEMEAGSRATHAFLILLLLRIWLSILFSTSIQYTSVCMYIWIDVAWTPKARFETLCFQLVIGLYIYICNIFCYEKLYMCSVCMTVSAAYVIFFCCIICSTNDSGVVQISTKNVWNKTDICTTIKTFISINMYYLWLIASHMSVHMYMHHIRPTLAEMPLLPVLY